MNASQIAEFYRNQYIPVSESKTVLEYFTNKVTEIKKSKELTNAGKVMELKQLNAAFQYQVKAWRDEMSAEREKIEKELEEKRPQVIIRELTAEQIAVLEYKAKILKSELAAKGAKSNDEFNQIMKQVIEGADPDMRQAFLDNYSDIKAITDNFEHSGKAMISDYFYTASLASKTDEEIAFDEYKKEADQRLASLTVQSIVIDKNTEDITSNAQLWGYEDEDDSANERYFQ